MKAGPSAQPVIRPKRKSRQVWVRETNASEPLMSHRNRSTGGIETGVPPLSGKSMAESCLLAIWCPVYVA